MSGDSPIDRGLDRDHQFGRNPLIAPDNVPDSLLADGPSEYLGQPPRESGLAPQYFDSFLKMVGHGAIKYNNPHAKTTGVVAISNNIVYTRPAKIHIQRKAMGKCLGT